MSITDEITALETALRRGVRSVTFGGETIAYQSAAEMRATLRDMKREAGLTAVTGGGRVYPEFTRGT